MSILFCKFPFLRSNGYNRYILPLLQELEKRGYTFYCITTDKIFALEFRVRQWHTFRFTMGVRIVDVLLATILLPLLLLWYRIHYRIRVLCCLTLVEKLIATPFARILGMRVLWMEYDLPSRRLSHFLSLPFFILFSRLATIVTVSNAARTAFEHIGIPPTHVTRIYPGAPAHGGWQTSLFTTLAETKQPLHHRKQFCVGTVAHLTRAHGIEYLLQAIRQCRAMIPDIQCIIVGHGPERQRLQWLADRLDIKENVLFVGWQAAAQKWITHFDIFVFPSVESEAFTSIMLEAMLAGKPVIGTNIGSVPEIIERTKTGMLVESKNSEMLSEAILNLYHHPEWREEMGARGRERAHKFFSLDQTVDEFEKIINNSN